VNGREQCVATDPEFFKAIMHNGSKAGMSMMEQDYICSTTVTTSQKVDAGDRWFKVR
jgi:hypothetical protein